jgi:hypothetical protein
MKPILILWVPSNRQFGIKGRQAAPLAEVLDMFIEYANAQLKPDTSVLVLPAMDATDFSVEVFNADNVPALDIEKLKEKVLNYAKSVTNE